jgi:predicted AAA+ superfamily ATPase
MPEADAPARIADNDVVATAGEILRFVEERIAVLRLRAAVNEDDGRPATRMCRSYGRHEPRVDVVAGRIFDGERLRRRKQHAVEIRGVE